MSVVGRWLQTMNAVGQFIDRRGFPVFVATITLLALVYVFVFRPPAAASVDAAAVERLNGRLETVDQKFDRHAAEMTDRIGEARRNDADRLTLLSMICENGAHTEEGRRACRAFGGRR